MIRVAGRIGETLAMVSEDVGAANRWAAGIAHAIGLGNSVFNIFL